VTCEVKTIGLLVDAFSMLLATGDTMIRAVNMAVGGLCAVTLAGFGSHHITEASDALVAGMDPIQDRCGVTSVYGQSPTGPTLASWLKAGVKSTVYRLTDTEHQWLLVFSPQEPTRDAKGRPIPRPYWWAHLVADPSVAAAQVCVLPPNDGTNGYYAF
jgi:hypothetical protein